MDKPKTTPKDFFLWFGAMLALYISVFAFIALIFSYLNYALPDSLDYYSSDPYAGGVSYQMALLLVLYPLFVILSRIVHKNIEQDPSRAEVWVRRWALYLTLFIAAFTVAADLVTLIMYFFNGDVSVRFLLKVLVILLVAGAGFLHFLADLRGFWERNPSQARTMGYATAALALITILAGFFIIGTPWQARQYRLDEQRVNDLSNIQSQVVTYWQQKEMLPENLSNLSDSLNGNRVPLDPASGASYEYSKTGNLTFKVCASFSAPTHQVSGRTMPYYYGSDNWDHGAGHTCFDRTIDPDRNPPYTKPVPVPM